MCICNDRFQCSELTRTFCRRTNELRAHATFICTEVFHVEHSRLIQIALSVPRGTLSDPLCSCEEKTRDVFHVEYFCDGPTARERGGKFRLMSCRLPTFGSLVIENRRRDIANKLRAATLIPL